MSSLLLSLKQYSPCFSLGRRIILLLTFNVFKCLPKISKMSTLVQGISEIMVKIEFEKVGLG